MEEIKIGNWIIKADGIHWNSPINEYLIPKDELIVSGTGNREKMYDWLVHLPSKTWLSIEDVYALNTAFIAAMEYYNQDFESNSFIKTF